MLFIIYKTKLIVVLQESDEANEMTGIKKKQTQSRKRKYRNNNETRRDSASNRSNRSSRVMTKNFEIFVTDFLADPCGLPVELRECVLVDGSTALNEPSDSCSSNNSQVLKKIFANNESDDRVVKSSVALVVEGNSIVSEAFPIGYSPFSFEESSKKVLESEQRINV